jgi:predicted metalloprotease with PDZ domain
LSKKVQNYNSNSIFDKKNEIMFKSSLAIAFSFSLFAVFGQSIKYNLKMPRPQSHYFNVEMEVSDLAVQSFDVKMPVWAPGSYLVREFAKNVNLVKAFDENGKELEVLKKTKNKWTVSKGTAKKVTVKYEVYSFELSVRTSFIDLTHGFISGTSIFMYIEELKNTKGTLEIFPYKTFKTISTALPYKGEGLSKEGSSEYEFTNYDQLVDCPIEIGNQEVFEFKAAGVNHTVAIYGIGNHDISRLKEDMAKIVEKTSAVVGENPNKNYTFIIHNVIDGQGGLEHMNSTTLSVNRWTYEGSEYINFLSLVAHEYFHLWNVKRIRPIELGPFNYDEENYTSLLWVMEGFTSYYDELLLLRAGYYSEEMYLPKLLSSLNYVEGSVGTRIQPVAHSSFDAWIKSYRPNENSSNTTMTYYSRGGLLAACLDAMIISKFEGKKGLDHFLQQLYNKFYKKLNRGFTELEFQEELEAFLGEDLDQFFKDYVFGTKVPDYNAIFSKIGVKVEYTGVAKPSFGATTSTSGGKVIVKNVRVGSAAEEAGLSVNDEVIGCNGFRVDQADFDGMVNSANTGDEVSVLVARDELLFELKVKITAYERPQYKLTPIDSPKTNALKEFWLRK